jgi:hypothetical protein
VFLTAIGADKMQIETSFCEAIRIAKEQKSVSLEKRAEASYAEYCDLAAKSTPIAMPNSWLANLDWTYSSYQISFRQVTVTHHIAFSRLGASITLVFNPGTPKKRTSSAPSDSYCESDSDS